MAAATASVYVLYATDAIDDILDMLAIKVITDKKEDAFPLLAASIKRLPTTPAIATCRCQCQCQCQPSGTYSKVPSHGVCVLPL